jgi:hypothetical protein
MSSRFKQMSRCCGSTPHTEMSMGVTGAFVMQNSVETASDVFTSKRSYRMKRNQNTRLVKTAESYSKVHERRNTMIRFNFSMGIRVLVSVALLTFLSDRERSPSSA